MRTRKSLLAALTSGLLVGPLASAGPAEAAAPAATAPGSSASSQTVTLVTGDRITLTGNGGIAVHRSGDRDGVTFLAYRVEGHQYVIPSDALGMVRDGRLDRRLFDVTLLREFGYDDRRADLPLIVTGRRAPATLADAAGQTDLPVVDGVAAHVDKAELGEFWDGVTDSPGETGATLAAGVSTVWLDGMRQPALDESVPQVGAPAAHAVGLDGTGATVAVLDTGIDVTHPDLADQVVESANFTEGEEDDPDLVGHGTHVASIVAGTGAASDGQFQGVAPGAGLLNGKVCTEFGCAESWLLAGMQWAAEQGADVVNMSLGGTDLPGLDPVEQAVETLTAEYGTLFVIAAGNAGDFLPVSSPASAPAAVAVGAVDKADQLAEFSSRGPSVEGALKPDITAPGVEITAANSKDGFLGEPGEPYTTLDGTSMSTPHVAGAAAILVQQHPEWTPAQLKAALMGSAAPHPELVPYAQGSGRLDVSRAVAQAVTADPPSVGFDRPLWPHGDDEPQSRTVTYVNAGDTDVILELAMAASGPDGEPAPAGFFTLGSDTVTVPAGGSAEVTLTVDTSVGEVDGFFGGYLTATGPDVVVTTPFAVDREVESYDVTLPHTGRDGAPPDFYSTLLIRRDAAGLVDVFSAGAVPTVRLPAGEYTLLSFVILDESEQGAGDSNVTLLAHPRFVVDGDMTVPVDAREAGPISVTVPEPSAASTLGAVMADVVTEENGASFFALADSVDFLFSGQLGPDQSVDGFVSAVTSAWARPDAEGRFTGTPYTYDLTWFELGTMVTGFTRDVKPRDLAAVRASHALQVSGVDGWKASLGVLPGVMEGGVSVILPEPTPFRRTEYHNTDGGIRWSKSFEEVFEDFEAGIFESFSYTESPYTAYRAGRPYREQWNQAVFGPVLPDCAAAVGCAPAVSRLGDQLEIVPRVYGDSAGRPGFRPAEQTITIYRDGELVAEVTDFAATVEVPPGTADYRVEVAAASGEAHQLSTSISVAWTFRSGHVDGEEPVLLPVSVVRFTPRLDQHNTAPAGQLYVIPVTVVGQPGSDAARAKRPTVEISFDDGASWRRVPVIAGLALVKHPAGDGFVSLRASVSDRAGNTVEQTIIRAYAIG